MLFDTEKGARPFTLYTVDFHINILLAKNHRAALCGFLLTYQIDP
jgi:hypothetical protein